MRERIILKEDHGLLLQLTKDLIGYKPLLESVKETFNKLHMEPFSEAVFEEVKRNPSAISAQFRAAILEQLNRSAVTFEPMREESVKQSTPYLNTFEQALDSLISYNPPNPGFRTAVLQLRFISYNDAVGFHISEADREKLLDEFCRTSIETENEQKVYEGVLAFSSALVSLEKILSEVGYLEIFKQQHKLTIDALLIESEGAYSPRPETVKMISVIERQKQEEDKRMSRALLNAKKIRDEKAALNARFDSGDLINAVDPQGYQLKAKKAEQDRQAAQAKQHPYS